jgi:hypothetical protein
LSINGTSVQCKKTDLYSLEIFELIRLFLDFFCVAAQNEQQDVTFRAGNKKSDRRSFFLLSGPSPQKARGKAQSFASVCNSDGCK